jgi:hypothetical protein
MAIEVHNRDQSSNSELRSWALEMVSSALRRFDSHIRRVVVRIQDINGPRGGIDKDVSIRLDLRGGGTKHLRQRDTSYEAAIVKGLRRAKRLLQRSQRVGARRPARQRGLT